MLEINCDLGEGSTAADCQQDARLMPYIQRVNIACGGHAGNSQTMRLSLQNAKQYRLLIGAHPGYADKANFGRVSPGLDWSHIVLGLQQQLSDFFAIAAQLGCEVNHIKLHGALYNDVEASAELAAHYAQWVAQSYPHVALLGLAGGQLQQACSSNGHLFIAEAFMDRRYLPNGHLMPRREVGSVLEKESEVVQQALAISHGSRVICADGSALSIKADSLCLHGDTPGALALARRLAELD